MYASHKLETRRPNNPTTCTSVPNNQKILAQLIRKSTLLVAVLLLSI